MSTDKEQIKSLAEQVDHPSHYGGKENTYEAIKVIDAWGLGFHLGNVIKYISRAGKKDPKNPHSGLKEGLVVSSEVH